MDTIVASDSRKAPFIWLNAELDDLELTLQEMRLLQRIYRRAGSNSQCYESMQSIADTSGMCRSKVKEALKSLEKKKIVTVVRRKGEDGRSETNLITPNDKSVWVAEKWPALLKKQGGGGVTTRPGGGHHITGEGSPHNHKEDPTEPDPIEPDPKKEGGTVGTDSFLPPAVLEKKLVKAKPKQPLVKVEYKLPPALSEVTLESLTDDWMAYAETIPNLTPQRENYLKAITTVCRRKNLSPAELREVLAFVISDKFWVKNVLSPAGLLNPSGDSSVHKIDNVLAQMRNSKQFKTQKVEENLDAIMAKHGISRISFL